MYHRHSYPVVVKDEVILRFFKYMESMARDLRHPYIPCLVIRFLLNKDIQLNIRTTDEEMVHLLAAHGQTRALTFFQVIHPGSANSSCMPVTCIHFSDRANAGRMPVQQHKL